MYTEVTLQGLRNYQPGRLNVLSNHTNNEHIFSIYIPFFNTQPETPSNTFTQTILVEAEPVIRVVEQQLLGASAPSPPSIWPKSPAPGSTGKCNNNCKDVVNTDVANTEHIVYNDNRKVELTVVHETQGAAQQSAERIHLNLMIDAGLHDAVCETLDRADPTVRANICEAVHLPRFTQRTDLSASQILQFIFDKKDMTMWDHFFRALHRSGLQTVRCLSDLEQWLSWGKLQTICIIFPVQKISIRDFFLSFKPTFVVNFFGVSAKKKIFIRSFKLLESFGSYISRFIAKLL